MGWNLTSWRQSEPEELQLSAASPHSEPCTRKLEGCLILPLPQEGGPVKCRKDTKEIKENLDTRKQVSYYWYCEWNSFEHNTLSFWVLSRWRNRTNQVVWGQQLCGCGTQRWAHSKHSAASHWAGNRLWWELVRWQRLVNDSKHSGATGQFRAIEDGLKTDFSPLTCAVASIIYPNLLTCHFPLHFSHHYVKLFLFYLLLQRLLTVLQM